MVDATISQLAVSLCKIISPVEDDGGVVLIGGQGKDIGVSAEGKWLENVKLFTSAKWVRCSRNL